MARIKSSRGNPTKVGKKRCKKIKGRNFILKKQYDKLKVSVTIFEDKDIDMLNASVEIKDIIGSFQGGGDPTNFEG